MEDEIEEELSREKEVVGERKRWLMMERNAIERVIKVLKKIYDKETYSDYRELLKSCIDTLNDLLKMIKEEIEGIEILEELEIE
ncbi:MAG: hypothetical protein ACTSVA_06495 [Candidatus Njordarchaeales archaeon]